MVDPPTPSAPPAAPPAESPQDLWLAELGKADNYTRWIHAQLAPHLGARVLEIGCGTGTLSALLAEGSERFLAVDSDPAYAEAAHRRLAHWSRAEARHADATRLELDEVFDTVIMLDVLEHIERDVALLARLREFLNPGGGLIVKVPAGPGLYSSMDEVVGHHRRYSSEVLRDAFKAAGFSDTRVWPFNVFGIPGWWWNGKVLRRTMPPGSQIAAFDRLVPLFRAVESLLRPPVGLSLFALGRID
jgi:SAM-dependent methyltransferase